jgi:hypothetical protein
MTETLKTDEFKRAVEDVLSAKEKAEADAQLKVSVQEAEQTILALTDSLETASKEVETVKASNAVTIEQKEKEIALYQLKVGQLEGNISEMSTSKAELQKSLDYLKSIAEMDKRLASLGDKGVIMKGEALEKQKIKVASLSDEDFESYVSDLITIKSEFSSPAPEPVVEVASTTIELTEEEIDQFAKIVGCDKADSKCVETIKDVAKRVKAYNDTKAPAPVTTEVAAIVAPPAKLDPRAQVMASLNLETRPSEDIIARYQKLGEALANKRNPKVDNK